MSNVSILIKKLKSLDEISFNFDLSPGVNVLCGENGVGKSTLMNVMSKLFDATALRRLFKSEVDESTEIEFHFTIKQVAKKQKQHMDQRNKKGW